MPIEICTQMNAVEIEQVITKLVEQPFYLVNFSNVFLEAFGSRVATIKRMISKASNRFNLVGVLQPSTAISTFLPVKRAKAW
ncbi:hypothetical protein [Symbiopectobacterium purcellii]|uniref:Uncharacterized protein n=1 Tax=Symbiopectobacterium purcellii TaxID=2871826 RepID=A0ABX9AIZ4_9ENTR|nr:hypothetical protein [Symbiopectobacterium purcellii]QZN94619.1 hypothetical protein K6K13_15160 [Symbiopectobacterium purcellii]